MPKDRSRPRHDNGAGRIYCSVDLGEFMVSASLCFDDHRVKAAIGNRSRHTGHRISDRDRRFLEMFLELSLKMLIVAEKKNTEPG